MVSKKRILMVHNYYQIGGGEHSVFENEVKMLQKYGHEVITYTRSNEELKSSKRKLFFLPLTTIWSFQTYFHVRKAIRDYKIDILHCHNTFPLISPSVYYAARSLRKPVIQTIHNFRFLCPAGIFYCKGKICEKCRESKTFVPALNNKCYRNSKLQTAVMIAMLKFHRVIGTYKKISYIFLTAFNKNKFSGLIDTNSSSIYIKPNFVCEPQVIANTQDARAKFVFAGRLEENKGVQFLLDVWQTLPEDYLLHVYGEGTLKAVVEEKARSTGNIIYKGFQSQIEILKDIASAKAVLFPSKCYEGFPMILAESYSVGVPVIASDMGNQKDIVCGANGGVTFTVDDSKSFQEAVADIIKNQSQYGINAKKSYDESLNESRNYNILEDIYDKARHID